MIKLFFKLNVFLLSILLLVIQVSPVLAQTSTEDATTETPEEETIVECLNSFDDVDESNIFCKYIEFLRYQEVVSPNDSYNPASPVTRGQFAKMIVEGLQLELGEADIQKFPDLDSENVFESYLNILVTKEIISGFSDGTIKPDESITRGQAVKIIAGVLELFEQTLANGPHDFSDISDDNVFENYISKLYTATRSLEKENQIISGYSDGTFKSDENITRDQASKIITNTIKLLNKVPKTCAAEFCQEELQEVLVRNPKVFNGIGIDIYDGSRTTLSQFGINNTSDSVLPHQNYNPETKTYSTDQPTIEDLFGDDAVFINEIITPDGINIGTITLDLDRFFEVVLDYLKIVNDAAVTDLINNNASQEEIDAQNNLYNEAVSQFDAMISSDPKAFAEQAAASILEDLQSDTTTDGVAEALDSQTTKYTFTELGEKIVFIVNISDNSINYVVISGALEHEEKVDNIVNSVEFK